MYELIKILFPYLVILYLIDGVTYVGTYHLLFTSYFGKHFKIIKSGAYFFNISPLSYLVFAYNFPLWFTRTGVYFPSAERHYESVLYYVEDFQYITYDNMESIEFNGNKLRINGETILKTPSAVGAKYITTVIQELRNLSSIERSKRIKAVLREATNLREILAFKEAQNGPFFYLKLLSSFLFVSVFFVVPMVLYTENLSVYLSFSSLFFIIALTYLLTVMTASLLRQKIYHTNTGKIITEILFAVLSPVTVIQFPGHITKDMYVQFDYLTIAAVLLSPPDFQNLMRQELYRIDHVKHQKNDADWVEFWRLRTESLHTLLEQSGITLSEVFATPVKQIESSASYCPICLSEYRAGFEYCRDCSMVLKVFKE